jgi:hypothetical protein
MSLREKDYSTRDLEGIPTGNDRGKPAESPQFRKPAMTPAFPVCLPKATAFFQSETDIIHQCL